MGTIQAVFILMTGQGIGCKPRPRRHLKDLLKVSRMVRIVWFTHTRVRSCGGFQERLLLYFDMYNEQESKLQRSSEYWGFL